MKKSFKKVINIFTILAIIISSFYFTNNVVFAAGTVDIPGANAILNLQLLDVGTSAVRFTWKSVKGYRIIDNYTIPGESYNYEVTHYGVFLYAGGTEPHYLSHGTAPDPGSDPLYIYATNVPQNITDPYSIDPEVYYLDSIINNQTYKNKYNNIAENDNKETHLWVCFWVANYNAPGPWYPTWFDLGAYENLTEVNDNAQIPVITHPIDQYVNQGQSASFTVSAIVTDGGTLSYQWQKLETGNVWVDIENENSAILTIANTTLDQNNSQYRCIVSNTLDDKTAKATSNIATLYVTEIVFPDFVITIPNTIVLSSTESVDINIEAVINGSMPNNTTLDVIITSGVDIYGVATLTTLGGAEITTTITNLNDELLTPLSKAASFTESGEQKIIASKPNETSPIAGEYSCAIVFTIEIN